MQYYSLSSCSFQDTNLANEMHAGVRVRPCSLWQSPVRVKEPASSSQLARWQLAAYFLAAQKLPIRHPLTACAPLLSPPSSLRSLPSEKKACLSAQCFAHSPVLPPFSYRPGEILGYVWANPGLPAWIFLCQPLG